MIKSELVQFIADRNPHLFQRDVENIVNSVFEEISTALAEGNRVELRGFGEKGVRFAAEFWVRGEKDASRHVSDVLFLIWSAARASAFSFFSEGK